MSEWCVCVCAGARAGLGYMHTLRAEAKAVEAMAVEARVVAERAAGAKVAVT